MSGSLGNKEVMAKNIRKQLESRGLNVKDFAARMDFKYSTVLDWVNAKTYPRIDKIELMANYFGIEKADLIEENNQLHTTSEESIDLSNLREKVVMFDGKPLSDDDVKKIEQIIRLSIEVMGDEDWCAFKRI